MGTIDCLKNIMYKLLSRAVITENRTQVHLESNKGDTINQKGLLGVGVNKGDISTEKLSGNINENIGRLQNQECQTIINIENYNPRVLNKSSGSNNPQTPVYKDKDIPPIKAMVILSAQLTADNRAEYENQKFELEAIIEHLRQITGDDSIRLTLHEKGSIKLFLEGSPEGLEKLSALFKSGELTDVLGIPIEEVNLLLNKNTEVEEEKKSHVPTSNQIGKKNNQQQLRLEQKEFYKHVKSFTGIDAIWLVNQFIQSPNHPRKKTYSSEEFITLCLLLLGKNEPYIFVPSYERKTIISTLVSEEEMKGLMELKAHRIFSLTPREMRQLRIKYEKEKTTEENEKRLEVLEKILTFIEYYQKYNSLKTGTGVIRRVKDDIKYYLQEKAIQWGLDSSDNQLNNDYVFWISNAYKQESSGTNKSPV